MIRHDYHVQYHTRADHYHHHIHVGPAYTFLCIVKYNCCSKTIIINSTKGVSLESSSLVSTIAWGWVEGTKYKFRKSS